ncbi:phosphomannomutase [bacterium DOLZORAL124_38_8]|nr:MAG: phosphomannomutase [bacterium DOLZORAL124_38_8]
MILNPKIFRAYDIRGEAFVDFDEDGFFLIAQAFSTHIKTKHNVDSPRIFVSGDGRQSMPELWPAVVAGLESSGAQVVFGGAIPTPMNYFSLSAEGFDAAIQISASHNPAADNGLKLTDKWGAVCGDEIQEIRKLAECRVCEKISETRGGCVDNCQKFDLLPAYKQMLHERNVPHSQAKKLVIDAGNAIPGLFYPDLLRSFGHEVNELYCDLNTTFPNHQPDPERSENLAELVQSVQQNQADFGFAFDGDGDRIGVVLSDGTILNADKILFVLASDFLTRNPREKIVLDAMCSDVLAAKIEAKGGEVVWSKTGHSHIEHAMKNSGALFGGEQSGHIMFGENFFGYDDALVAAIRFLQALENNPSLLKEVTDGWPELLETSEKFLTTDEQKFKILGQFVADIQKKFPQVNTIDGARISFGNNEWAIVRCSNTTPKIAVRIEAQSEENLKQYAEDLIVPLQRLL